MPQFYPLGPVSVHDERMDALPAVLAQAHDLADRRDRVAVGVDGADAAGKSTFADRLAASLDLAVLRASLDDFHRPREARYRRGRFSPEGYYRDAFDHAAARRVLLDPFLAGAGTVRTAIFDHRSDTAVDDAMAEVPNRAVLVVDGMFLLRSGLRDAWTMSVYLDVSGDESLRRGRRRDGPLVGEDAVERLYRERYLPAQMLYMADVNPREVAHVVVGNGDPSRPLVVRWNPPAQT
jgi:uridine kinase